MSVYTEKTALSSILKAYSPAERDRAKIAAINKVRFELPKEYGVVGAIEGVLNNSNYTQYNEFISFIRESNLDDKYLLRLVTESRRIIHLLKPSFSALIESLLSLNCFTRNQEITQEFVEFYIDLLVAHNKFASFGISKLISYWIPKEEDIAEWEDGCPSDSMKKQLESVHKILQRLLYIIPMTFDVIMDTIEELFPYYKKPAYVISGYIHNIFWLLDYKPIFNPHMLQLLFKKVLLLDVNAPRSEIEESEYEEEDMCNEIMFPIDNDNGKVEQTVMNHPVAQSLDVCMDKLFTYLHKYATQNKQMNCVEVTCFFKILQNSFDSVILPSHNTHHIQFLMFYFCSFKGFLAEKFLNDLWSNVVNPNVSAPIRQASVGYIASFLARAKFLTMGVLRSYLTELCTWSHQYIQRSDSIRGNHSLKANVVFYSICQAVFYVIAFRSKDLTSDNESLLFLQSLHLSALVTCNLNPLKVCLPAVATAFAGVTRAYQLAYCHTILERNARQKLATVYTNEISMPEECLDTFFPFDPYLLKKSGKRITPIYLQYQASESEEETPSQNNLRRKREDSSSAVDDIDDFIVDKRQKCNELARSHDKEMQFTYGLSPGFHT